MSNKLWLLVFIAIATGIAHEKKLTKNCYGVSCDVGYNEPIEIDTFIGDRRKISIRCEGTDLLGKFVQVEFWAEKDGNELLKFVGNKTKKTFSNGDGVEIQVKQLLGGEDFSPRGGLAAWKQEKLDRDSENIDDKMTWIFEFYADGKDWTIVDFQPVVNPVVYAYFTHLKVSANGDGICKVLFENLDNGPEKQGRKQLAIDEDVYLELKDKFCNGYAPVSDRAMDSCGKSVRTKTSTSTEKPTTTLEEIDTTTETTPGETTEVTTESASTAADLSTSIAELTITSSLPSITAKEDETTEIDEVINSTDANIVNFNTSTEGIAVSTMVVNTTIPVVLSRSGGGFDKKWQLIVFGNAGIIAIPLLVLLVLAIKGVVLVDPEKQLVKSREPVNYKVGKLRSGDVELHDVKKRYRNARFVK